MMGIDTNVLVRYLTRDDENQALAARLLIRSAEESADPLFINHMVLCELLWVLRSVYRFERSQVMDVMGKILETPAFSIEDKDVALGAFRDFQAGGADFPDCLIGRKNRDAGCDATLTFDGQAARMATFRLLETPPTTT